MNTCHKSKVGPSGVTTNVVPTTSEGTLSQMMGTSRMAELLSKRPITELLKMASAAKKAKDGDTP